MSKERPIIFSGETVRAILEGRKTQTRRVIKPQPEDSPSDGAYLDAYNGGPSWNWWTKDNRVAGKRDYKCPYGVPGDRLWVREMHYRYTGCRKPPWSFVGNRCYVDNPDLESLKQGAAVVTVPSIFMPRWASRILLEITDVRVERVQDITYKGALEEGACASHMNSVPPHPIDCFHVLWDSINAHRGWGWDVNPWIWAVTFKRVED